MLESLKEQVYRANMMLVELGLVKFTWGNVSGIGRESGYVAIKPSGVEYSTLRPEDIVLVDLDANIIEGSLNPSSDTLTHLELYRGFPEIGGITHTHSPWAVSFAQAGYGIPAMGTTHADTFDGTVPCTRKMSKEEIRGEYERNTGLLLAEQIRKNGKPALNVPGALVHSHGPFTWGADAAESVHNAAVLELVAEMAYHSMTIKSVTELGMGAIKIPNPLLRRHFDRKHGDGAYYGQEK